MSRKTEFILFLKDLVCKMVCDPSMDFCGYFSNIGDSRFYNLCRENGYQMDMAFSEIVDALFLDEDYIRFSQENPNDNFFTYVISFVGFFTIHNLHPDSIDDLKTQFVKLYNREKL